MSISHDSAASSATCSATVAALFRPMPSAEPGPMARQAQRALLWSARAWLVVALAGQALFAVYVLAFYGAAAVAGRLDRWNGVLPHGWVPGDAVANSLTALHLAFTVLIIGGGLLQLLPAVRRLAPAVHRWNGRVYIVSALVMATGGLVMMLTRRTVGDAMQHTGLMLNAVLIVVLAVVAWRLAAARQIERHRRWALRLFLAVSGVWFFRVGLMAWLLANRGPVGFDPQTFQGPFLSFLAFAQYAVPLLVLEGYLRARDHGGPIARIAMSGVLAVATLCTALGVVGAGLVMWGPRIVG